MCLSWTEFVTSGAAALLAAGAAASYESRQAALANPVSFTSNGIALGVQWYDIVGLLGVALILGAYLRLQIGKLDSSASLFSVLNGAGAALVLISLLFDFNLSAFIVESFWLLLSVVGLVRARGVSGNRVPTNHTGESG